MDQAKKVEILNALSTLREHIYDYQERHNEIQISYETGIALGGIWAEVESQYDKVFSLLSSNL